MSYSSDGDYTWLRARFGVERYMSSEQLQQIIISLRVSLIPDAADVSALLAEYLEDRFADFFGQLRYIAENLQSVTDEVGALAEAYSYRDSRVKFPDGEIPKRKLERQPIVWIREREQFISTVREAGTRIEAFERFAVLERDLEPIETAVEDLVVEIDNYIDMQVDIMRGK
jgi:hypothetical protein